MTTKNIALIGFEYEFTPKALSTAIERAQNELEITFIPKIWSARDGIETEVHQYFPACNFYNQNYLEENARISTYKHLPLSELHYKHFHYTHVRMYYFNWSRKIPLKTRNYYNRLVQSSWSNLQSNEVRAVIFAEIPHSMIDYSYYVAAELLNLPLIIRNGPYFGNINTSLPNRALEFSHGDNKSSHLKDIVSKSMRSRDISTVREMPDYMTSDVTKTVAATVPVERKITYSRELQNRLSLMGAPPIFIRLLNKILQQFSTLVSRVHFFFLSLLNQNISYISNNRQTPYILVLLQYHPEFTTSSAANDTPFEEERLENLLKKFSEHDIVALEHPTIKRNNSVHKYRSIWRLLRLRLKFSNFRYSFSPTNRTNYADLVSDAFATLSTSGTHALESIQVGVPAIHFSNSFVTDFPGVVNLSSVDSLSSDMIQKKRDELAQISNEELVQEIFEIYSRQPLTEGFISGFHRGHFTSQDYITNGSAIFYNLLRAFTK